MQYLTSIKRFLLILIAIFSSVQFKLTAQTAKETYIYADSLIKVNDYEAAIPLLRRVVFFDSESFPLAYGMLGDCYGSINQKEKSLYYYKLALNFINNDSLKTEARFDIIALHLKNDEPNYALSQLLTLKTDYSDYLSRKKDFYFSLAYFQIGEFDKSSKYLKNALLSISPSAITSIDSVYKTAKRNNRFNPNFPMFLSAIPGLGQLYLGEYEAAANSFLLTSALVVVYIVTIKELTILDALLSIFPWFQRYYSGGILQAKALAIEKKDLRHYEAYNGLIKIYYNSLNP